MLRSAIRFPGFMHQFRLIFNITLKLSICFSLLISSNAYSASLLDAISDFADQFAGATGNVALIKNGSFNDYQQNTIGNVFDYAFDEPVWTEFQTERGERIVQFDGKISENLHNSVINNIKDQFQTLNYVQSIQFKISLISRAVLKAGGLNAVIIEAMNDLFGCEIHNWNGRSDVFAHTCSTEEGKTKYEKAMLDYFYDHFWKVGNSASVQWTIDTNGSTFNLTYMENADWTGMEMAQILTEIYR